MCGKMCLKQRTVPKENSSKHRTMKVWHDVACMCDDYNDSAETVTLERLEYTGSELADIRIGEKWDWKTVACCGCGRTTIAPFLHVSISIALHHFFKTCFLYVFYMFFTCFLHAFYIIFYMPFYMAFTCLFTWLLHAF